jgi:hypothetical protein
MNRKGISEQTVVILAVFIVAMLVILFLFGYLRESTKAGFTKAECRASLLLTRAIDSAQPICIVQVPNPTPLHCDRNVIGITNKEVLLNGDDVKQLYKLRCGTDASCVPKSVVADQLATCWDQFFQGQQPVFQQMEEDSYKIFTYKDKKTACFICSEITIKTDADIEQFNAFLKTKYKNSTYYDYLNTKGYCKAEYRTQGACFEGYAKAHGLNWDRLEKGKTYAVTYVREGLATCAANQAPSENPDLTMTVQLIPIEKVPEKCAVVLA